MIAKIIKSYNQNNHIIISFEGASFVVTFQSYDKIMLSVSRCGVILNEDLDDYTKTTCKYMYEAINDIANDIEFAGYTSAGNAETLNALLYGDKKKNIIAHMIRQTSRIQNSPTGASIFIKS
jgi:hypothetical protein